MHLRTDYSEAYDSLLIDVPSDLTLERMAFSQGGLSKREAFAMFDRLGIPTPPHGLVRDLKQRLLHSFQTKEALASYDPKLVVYLDEHGHCGMGKELLPLSQAPEDRYASLYFPTTPGLGAITFRKIRFGPIEYWRRNSSADWRSNIDCTRTVIRRSLDLPIDTSIPRILWAIDYIPTPLGLLAIDFNTAPSFELIDEEFPEDKYHYIPILTWCAHERPNWLKQL